MKKTVEIAVLYSHPYEYEEVYEIILMAQDEINTYSKKYEFNFLLHYLPNNPQLYNTTLKELEKNNIKFIIGPDFSTQCKRFIKTGDENKFLFVSPYSSDPELAIEDNLFRLKNDDTKQSKIIANILKHKNISKVAILCLNSSWSKLIVKKINEDLEKNVITIIDKKIYNSSNYKLEELELSLENYRRENKMDVCAIIHIGTIETEAIFDKIKNYPNLSSTTWIGTNSITSPLIIESFLKQNNSILSKIKYYCIQETYDLSYYYEANRTYFIHTGKSLDFTQCARYDACHILARSIIESDCCNIDIVSNNIISAVKQYRGLLGPIELNDYGDCSINNYKIYSYENNAIGTSLVERGYYNLSKDTIIWYENHKQ